MSATPTIFWFRRDLRLADNPALLAAVAAGRGHVAAVFVVDETFAAPAGAARVAYLRATLASLDQSLGSRLIVRSGEPGAELARLARETGAGALYATRDDGPQGRQRDARVALELRTRGVDTHFVDSNYVVAPGTIVTKAGTPCRVFGAFRRGWANHPVRSPLAAPRDVQWRPGSGVALDALTGAGARRRPWYFGDLADGAPLTVAPAGEPSATQRLEAFAAQVDAYDDVRNFPALDHTSRLSAYLRFGALHPRQVLDVLGGPTVGRRSFESEICWRDFYADVLFHQPDSVRRVVQPSLEHLRVDTDERAVRRFQTWARGDTGYPLVDAGMRQLLVEGWMHNRVRMVCASFLVKHLHLDWRWGAKWFMWRLIDGDVASNQHGWQWTAGTGTDASPFVRIFNPTLQAERFDPDGSYVHRFIPELALVPAPNCLLPGGGGGPLASNYSAPMIDASVERREALARFGEARELARVSP